VGERRTDQGANAGNCRQSLRCCARSPLSLDLLVDKRQMRLHGAEVIGKNSHDRESRWRNVRDVQVVLVEALHEICKVLNTRLSMTPNSAN
jgi:hypothetical protein